MPTYEYRCAKGHTFERFQKMSDPPEATCPECGAPAERVVSGGAGFVFKGAGFYITDYRSDDYKSKARTENPGAESAPSSGGEKKESKPDAPAKEKKKDPKPASKPKGGDE
jgi:putative FmdB family regulatory protein